MNIRINTLALAVGAAITLGIPSEIIAQERGASLEEVIVTATRREQSLQEVPLAVSSLSADEMAVRGITALSDIQIGMLPSVNFQTFAATPSILQIAIRGNGAADGTQGTVELPVPVYIDGVFLGRAQGQGLELIDPLRVEVLRGPQGQLFGRNAEGGAVQYVTRPPSGEFGVKARTSFGNYGYQRYKLSVDTPEVAGISANIAGLTSKHDGYTEQTNEPQAYVPPLPQKDYSELDADGYRIALRWEHEDVLVDYSYDDSQQNDQQGYVTWIPVDTRIAPKSEQPPSDEFPDDTFSRLYNPDFHTEASGHTLTLNWEMSEAINLKSITAYRETSREGGSNLGPALPTQGIVGLQTAAAENVSADQTSQELQFIGLWDQFDLTAGVIYYNEQVDDKRSAELTGQLAGPFVGSDPNLVQDSRQDSETDSYGIYAQGGWRPAAFEDQLELILGLRYSDDTKDAKRTYAWDFQNGGGPVDLQADFDEQRVDPALTVRYQWSDEINTYVRYATGYRAGGANVRSSTFTSFGKEVNETSELGMKSRWAGGLVQLNAALYHEVIEDEQLTIQEDPTGAPDLTNTINSPEDKKVDGAELELLWAATNNLNIGLNLAYMDADDTFDIDNPFTPEALDLTRFWHVQVPEYSGSVFADYNQPLPVGSLGTHISYAWSDDYWATPGAIPVVALTPAYERPANDSEQLSASVGWYGIEIGSGELGIALWGKNLTDDASSTYGFDGCAAGGGFCQFLSFPLTYGVEVRYDYF